MKKPKGRKQKARPRRVKAVVIGFKPIVARKAAARKQAGRRKNS